jgi:hypothetical protein
MDKTLTVFIYIWASGVVLLNLLGIAGAFVDHSFWDAVEVIQGWYAPHNFANLLINLVLLAPALGAMKWRDVRRRRALQQSLVGGKA